MRLSISLIVVALSTAFASPVTTLKSSNNDGELTTRGTRMGECGQDCWNEAAVRAKCDPNIDDNCLCGPFFDAVTTCTSQTCNTDENLATLDLLEPACE
ncbi:hypothetical protein P153DRAFT_400453 [Dothidotthia symphoricarpi CBS 119687]|uniref:CFEM domain-containing protein n=1 Tax=Dothidotthia symphoricarpi CBS 119687 TaxID=1392245 RepID=A0A6A5ZZI0_9PLEO|nr:uncharacterized protein P153DRAFT_400453 [Dothidotthia symphoricarpi CBS 119687]KAF2124950.1 hypothetical protein P153DRAFT_400453 [Dothidotthia symphoricarpi CBS 119687]